jgi:hypothetical protein
LRDLGHDPTGLGLFLSDTGVASRGDRGNERNEEAEDDRGPEQALSFAVGAATSCDRDSRSSHRSRAPFRVVNDTARRARRALVLVVGALVLSLPATAGSHRRGTPYEPPPIVGAWHRAAPLAAGAPPILVTTFRPDPADPGTVAYVAWIDHTRTTLGLYPGLEQPPVASPRGPAEIPHGQRWRLLAAFNSGFKFDSSGAGNGFSVDGHTYVWLRRGLGTLVGYRDGRVDVISWRGGPTPSADVAFARQNLGLIVKRGRSVPGLGDPRAWGATLGGATSVWRTAAGVDRHGNLLYAAAANQTPAGLAAIMVRAGAVRAIELDINPEWPTFNLYTHRGGLRGTMFVPNGQQTANRYLSPDSRDFFSVYRRTGASPVTVPFR